MRISIEAAEEIFPIAGKFSISRGSKTEARVVTVVVSDGVNRGRGECVPYSRYDETVEGVIAEIRKHADVIASRPDRRVLQTLMKPGAARNALDCALWDFESKVLGIPVRNSLSVRNPQPLTTAFTLSIGTPQEMAAAARAASDRPLLKIKVGGEGDIERLRAVAASAPNSKIILDANEGWTEENITANIEAAAALGVVLIEQPLPAGKDSMLRKFNHAVPICADESAHASDGLAGLKGLYDAVNIKLDKTGGLTEALAMRDKARALGFKIMVGCMVGTSLGMAPAVLLAQRADFVDLDGPLLLAKDRERGLTYEGSLVYPPERELWG
jgi:L-Ala-D/L-Glu epimerase